MTPERSDAATVLDEIAAGFARLLRAYGVAVSPAETIEIRRVLALIGGGDLTVLQPALRATCAKYSHEQPLFDLAFDAMFRTAFRAAAESASGTRGRPSSGGLPDEFDIADDADLGKYADYNERAVDVGDHFDLPEAEKGFNPHKDDDDISVTGGDSELSVDSQADAGRRGVEFTVEVDRAASANAGALADSSTIASESAMSWDDPRGILDWLDAFDAREIYATTDDGGPTSREQIERMLAAVENFVAALAAETAAANGLSGPSSGRLRTDTGPHRWEIEEGCREVLRRMRGAHRPKPRRSGHGRLDMRRTSRAGMRTDGVPFELRVMQPHPEPVRLLILADVSLSVRPITAFTLRLAQTMRRRSRRASVLAFVDSPVEVTDVLNASTGDGALADVLSAPELDLEASSDYGRVLTEVLGRYGDYVTRRTSVLIVGDGRSNGLDPKVDLMEELARKVHRVAWVTPEQERYWSQASCAMADYAEFCDAVVVARDAHELIARAPLLGSALR